MSTPEATSMRNAPVTIGRRDSRLRGIKGFRTVRSTTTNTAYRTMAAAMDRSVPGSAQPPSPALIMP
jgi:hypothetical protein